MELGLELPQGTLANRCNPSASEIRLNHYPTISRALITEGKIKRTWPHTDFGIITLLFQDSVGGLELEDRKKPGTFVPILPSPAHGPRELIVNVSNTLQRWTNNVIRAGLHQVSLPLMSGGLAADTCPERYSAVFFLKAHRDTCVGPLPHFVTVDRPAAYTAMTAIEYQRQMTQVLY